MAEIKAVIQSADWKSEKHVPAIECPDQVKTGEFFTVKATLGKAVAHPNTTEHHIRWIDVYFKPEGEKFIHQVAHFDFVAHAESTKGANEGAVLRAVLAPAREWQRQAEADREALRTAFLRQRAIAMADRVRQSTFRVDEARCRQCGLCFKACPVDAIRWAEGAVAFVEQDKCIRCGLCWTACPPHYDAIILEPAAAAADRTSVAYRVIDEQCERCGICFKKCPVDAIEWKKGEIARIDDALCVACGRCEAVCPPKWAAIVHEARAVATQPSAE